MRRVLSLRQPWASLCVTPDPRRDGAFAKKWETRHYPPKYATPIHVVIHATKRVERGPFRVPRLEAVLIRCGLFSSAMTPNPLPRGAIIGVADILVARPTEELLSMWRQKLTDIEFQRQRMLDELAVGDYSDGRFGWLLFNVKRLANPIPFAGRQDVLYELDEKTNALVDAGLRTLVDGH